MILCSSPCFSQLHQTTIPWETWGLVLNKQKTHYNKTSATNQIMVGKKEKHCERVPQTLPPQAAIKAALTDKTSAPMQNSPLKLREGLQHMGKRQLFFSSYCFLYSHPQPKMCFSCAETELVRLHGVGRDERLFLVALAMRLALSCGETQLSLHVLRACSGFSPIFLENKYFSSNKSPLYVD